MHIYYSKHTLMQPFLHTFLSSQHAIPSTDDYVKVGGMVITQFFTEVIIVYQLVIWLFHIPYHYIIIL